MVNSTILTPNSRKVRRKNELGKERSPAGTNDSTSELFWTTTTASDFKTESGTKNFSLRWTSCWNWGSFHSFTLVCLGVALAFSYFYYVTTLFESVTHFSHLSNLERELSLPTDVAFRYSFYKNIANAESYVEGLRSVIYDKKTDWPRVTNSFKKYSLAPEAVLGAGFHLLKRMEEWTSLKFSQCSLSTRSGSGGNGDEAFSCIGLGDTLHFYLYSFWMIESTMVFLLFFFGLAFSNSVVGGITTALMFIVVHPQCSNYQWIFPLNEKLGWAAALVQIYVLSQCVLKRSHPSWTGCVKMAVCTSFVILCWEMEAQWFLISQLLIVSLMHISSFISRYSAALVIFAQITGWQYASLVSIDTSFLHWSFFLYVLMSSIIAIFLVEPILDWVFRDKIDKWIFLRRTILLIAFQMILLSVRCDFGRVVGLKEDNRFPFSVGRMDPRELKGSSTDFVSSLIEGKHFGYFPPGASAEVLNDQRFQFEEMQPPQRRKRERELFRQRNKKNKIIVKISEEPVSISSPREYPSRDPFPSSSFVKNPHLLPDSFPEPFSNFGSSPEPDSKNNKFPHNTLPLVEEPPTEETITEGNSGSTEQKVKRVHARTETLIFTEKTLIKEKKRVEKTEDGNESQGKANNDKESYDEEYSDFSKFTTFLHSCYSAPLKFSPQIFCTKYILHIVTALYVFVNGVFMPILIYSRAESAEREKVKQLRNEQRKNGDSQFASTFVYDYNTFYNCYYRYMNGNGHYSFATNLGFAVEDDKATISNYYWNPVIIYNTCQCGFFLAFCLYLDKRWELLFITHFCLLLSLLCDYKRIHTVFSKVSCGLGLGTNIHWFVVFGIVSILFATTRISFDKMYQTSRGNFETTTNPKLADLVQAVKWIRMNTGNSSSFTGTESIVTSVYLSAQRPCVNHRHSVHLLNTEIIDSGTSEDGTFPPHFEPPAPAPDIFPPGRINTLESLVPSSEEEQASSPDGAFRKNKGISENDKLYFETDSDNWKQYKVIEKNTIEITSPPISESTPRVRLLENTDIEFEKREKESLYKVYSMFSRRKSISELHEGLVSLNVSYLFLSREMCSPPASSSSVMFFNSDSSSDKRNFHKSFSSYYTIWNWKEPTVDKEYAHWQKIETACAFTSFWDSVEGDEKQRNQKTDSLPKEETVCSKLINEKNVKPFKVVFENGHYTILSTSSEGRQ